MYAFSQSRPWLYLSGIFRNWRECLIGSWHFLQLRFQPIPQKSVLIVEFNPFHGETLPGHVYYFQQLGYEVVVLSRYCSYADSPFVRMPQKPHHYCLTLWGMRHYLKYHKVHDFEYIFYNSAHLFLNEYRYYGRVPDFLGGYLTEGRQGFGMIEHEFSHGDYRDSFHHLADDSIQKQQLFGNTFMLTPLEFESKTIPMLNPCYFGMVHTNHKLGSYYNGRKIFLTIGNVSKKSRNFPALLEALKSLEGRHDFEVWIIGRLVNPEVLEGINANVKILGRLTFAQMYECLEQADFFLPLLDPEHNSGYLDGCTSGSRQLILGFAIPPVIHTAFAQHFGLSKVGVISYDTNKLSDAMLRALAMTSDDYQQAKEVLQQDAEKVRKESLQNLSQRLSALCEC